MSLTSPSSIPEIPLSNLETIVPLLSIIAEIPSFVDLMVHLLFSIDLILVILKW